MATTVTTALNTAAAAASSSTTTTASVILHSTAAQKLAAASYVAFTAGKTYLRNARVTPVATYLAYKASGYADSGTLAGMSISDFVAVWTPYNIGTGSGRVKIDWGKMKGKAKDAGGKGGVEKGIRGVGANATGGTNGETHRVLMENEKREARCVLVPCCLHSGHVVLGPVWPAAASRFKACSCARRT